MTNVVMNLLTYALGAAIVVSLGYVGWAMYNDITADLPRMRANCELRGGELVTVHSRRICFRKGVIIHELTK